MKPQIEILTPISDDVDFLNSFEPMPEGGDPAANEAHANTYFVDEPLGAYVVAKSEFVLVA